jgi:hypothetical protein
MGPEMIHGQAPGSALLLAHDAQYRGGERQVLYGVEPQHDDGPGQGGDLVGQGVIGGIDEFEDLACQHRIKRDDFVEVHGRGVGPVADIQHPGNGGREARHPVDMIADADESLFFA